MTNHSNQVNLTGRLTRDPKIYINSDGSRKIYITLAVRRNFKDMNGEYKTDFINLEAFVPASKPNNGPYDYTKKGNLISVMGEARSSQWVSTEGVNQYKPFIQIESVQFRDKKPVTNAAVAYDNTAYQA